MLKHINPDSKVHGANIGHYWIQNNFDNSAIMAIHNANIAMHDWIWVYIIELSIDNAIMDIHKLSRIMDIRNWIIDISITIWIWILTLHTVNKITSLQRPWKVLLSFCKRCVKTSWGRQCVEFSLRPQNDLKKRCAGTLTRRSGDVGLHWWRPWNVARKFCFHKNFPGTLSESFVSNRIVCLCSVNVV